MIKTLDIEYLALRGGTTKQWEAANPVLHENEPGLEFCTDGSIKMKAGDGKTTWNSLRYVGEDETAKGDTILAGPVATNSPKLWLKGEQPEASGTGITVSLEEPGSRTMLWIKGV